ncbi:MAG: hypothetical protein IJ242_14800 [Clostridia bacterium]|jgi:hypothetical protein|nr:hypothetical protein [Clostridia bacterium]
MHRLISMLVLLLCLMPLTIHGETMIMGTYEQDNHPENGPEPISWIILDRQEDRMLLLSEYALDCRQYHVKYNNQTFYENCALRSWLNDTFYMEAFSSEERTRILQTTLANHRKKGYASKNGNDTEDLVFLLSFDECEQYLPEKKDRVCEATAYAQAQGVRTKSSPACPWWLRTSGRRQHHAACVTLDGGYYDFFDITCPTNGIRPAIWIAVTAP